MKVQIQTENHLAISSFTHKLITWNQQMWSGLQKLTMWAQKNHQFLPCLLYHSLITSYITATKSSSLLHNLMGVLFCSLRKWDSSFKTKDISEIITRCNLRSHGQFSQAQSQIWIIMKCYIHCYPMHRHMTYSQLYLQRKHLC